MLFALELCLQFVIYLKIAFRAKKNKIVSALFWLVKFNVNARLSVRSSKLEVHFGFFEVNMIPYSHSNEVELKCCCLLVLRLSIFVVQPKSVYRVNLECIYDL